jgi:hypothetical protein
VRGLPAEAALWRDRMLDGPPEEPPRRKVETDPARIKAFFGQTK